MTAARFTVLTVALRLEQDGRLSDVEIGGAFDEVRTQDQARAVAAQIADLLTENLSRRLQARERLAA